MINKIFTCPGLAVVALCIVAGLFATYSIFCDPYASRYECDDWHSTVVAPYEGLAISNDGVPDYALPDHFKTPGAFFNEVTVEMLAKSGYTAKVRNVPDSEKEEVLKRYNLPYYKTDTGQLMNAKTDKPYSEEGEFDHLISLELGGSNAIDNIWFELYAGEWGARKKDVLENKLNALIVSGNMSLKEAQRLIAHDWVSAYRQYVLRPERDKFGMPEAIVPSPYSMWMDNKTLISPDKSFDDEIKKSEPDYLKELDRQRQELENRLFRCTVCHNNTAKPLSLGDFASLNKRIPSRIKWDSNPLILNTKD